jgi:hypothetical protein
VAAMSTEEREYAIWAGGHRMAVVLAEDPRDAMWRYADELGASPYELTWLEGDGSAASWRGAEFRVELVPRSAPASSVAHTGSAYR